MTNHDASPRPATSQPIGSIRIRGIAPSSDGHLRLTRGDGWRLEGGDAKTHLEMHQIAEQIVAEAERQGLSLASATRSDAAAVADILRSVLRRS